MTVSNLLLNTNLGMLTFIRFITIKQTLSIVVNSLLYFFIITSNILLCFPQTLKAINSPKKKNKYYDK